MRLPFTLLLATILIPRPQCDALNAQAPTATAIDANASVSVRWNRLLAKFASEAAASRRAARAAATASGDSVTLRRIAQTQLPMTFNTYPLLSMAQYVALNGARGRISHRAAVASASAGMLTALYADSAVRASIATELARDLERSHAEPGGAEATTAGKNLGEGVARQLFASSPVLSLMGPWSGTIPAGPGLWTTARGVPPIGVALVKSRTWTLDSTSQFRPAPPPAFGSQTFDAAMEEVRRFARERTAEQTAIAQRWNSGDPMVVWNDKAVAAISRHRSSEAEAVRVLAVMNAAAADAAIACFEAKYHYWTIRPSQVDTTLKLAENVPLPNFPSYPSGHACSAGALQGVLDNYFPDGRADFRNAAEEQAMSRLYAGVHYRFDNDVGLDLGRIVARHAVKQEKAGVLKKIR